MYAVIASGGKQYRVSQGQVIKVEQIAAQPGDSIEFDQILLLADGDNVQVGTPYLPGTKIKGEVIRQGRGEKIRILKFRRRKHHMKQAGHRQNFTEIKITAIGDQSAQKPGE
jgi:large subunit ribosomal protein L21